MLRTLASIVAGLVTWGLVVTLLDFALRAGIPGYHAAEPALAFTLPMKIARLLEAAITSVVAGYVIAAIAPGRRYAPWIVGIVLLAVFVPTHVQIWSKLPVWYHLTFLLTLAPLVAAGAQLYPKRAGVA
jgi:ABC-type methionine transport system permease subunit